MAQITTFKEISPMQRAEILRIVKEDFGQHAVITENDAIQIMYPPKPNRNRPGGPYQPIQGYLSINGGECWICDNTPDEGDRVVARIRLL